MLPYYKRLRAMKAKKRWLLICFTNSKVGFEFTVKNAFEDRRAASGRNPWVENLRQIFRKSVTTLKPLTQFDDIKKMQIIVKNNNNTHDMNELWNN